MRQGNEQLPDVFVESDNETEIEAENEAELGVWDAEAEMKDPLDIVAQEAVGADQAEEESLGPRSPSSGRIRSNSKTRLKSRGGSSLRRSISNTSIANTSLRRSISNSKAFLRNGISIEELTLIPRALIPNP